MVVIIDADEAILGRLASHVAKTLLLGEKVVIVNAEMAIVTGNKETSIKTYKEKFDRGHRYKGPFFPKEPHMIVKRTIRGMLPWKASKGQAAFKRLMVHLGVPEEFEGKAVKIKRNSLSTCNAPKYMRLSEIAKVLGWESKI